jgi:hypothetical protein
LALGAFCEVTGEEIEEGLHLGVECPFGGGVLDGGDETGDLVAHGLGRDAGGGGLEVDVGRPADTSVEGVAAGHERGGHVVNMNRACGVCGNELGRGAGAC